MTELTEQMRAVMQPTHEMVGNISSRLSALELKVVSMDAELKKQVSEVQLALKSVATSAELVALTERVVLLEEHMSDVRAGVKGATHLGFRIGLHLRRSAINKENRAKLKIVNTSGARKKWKRYSCSTSQRESHTQKWRSSEVLGTKAGYMRGLGRSVRSVRSSSSVSSVDLSGGWKRPDYKLRRRGLDSWNMKRFLSNGQIWSKQCENN
ncbi:hypothetical protein CJ030_MR6G013857 [Morella rubra]|uniref:Uncharacterized protein n=1 Tax=Morella rubra TaxID=262757 RepID=A0A6A1VCW5_9ROSI|nr:hypothetical protein CJ030_MR6G013857 [Morella rubra]